MPSDAIDIGPSDAELVARAQRGDSYAFSALVLRYQDRIFNVAFRMCRNRDDAADVTQTTFLNAMTALPRFRTHATVYTWLFRIATNLCISGLRQRRRKTTSLDAVGQEFAARGNDRAPRLVSDDLEQREMMERVEIALAELDDEFRTAVLLRDVEGLDYGEISQVLGVPVGTVKSRIHRGRTWLRKRLTAGEHEMEHEHESESKAV